MNSLMNISTNILILLLLHLLERKVIEGRLQGEFDGLNYGMFSEKRDDNGKYDIGKKWYPIDDDESGWESESLKKEQEKLTENGSFNSSVKEHQPDLYNSDQVDDMSDAKSDESVGTQGDNKESQNSPKIESNGMPNAKIAIAPPLNGSKKNSWYKGPKESFRKIFSFGRHSKSQNGKRKFLHNASGRLKEMGTSFGRRIHRNQRNGTNSKQKRLSGEPGMKMPTNHMQINSLIMTPFEAMNIIDDIYGIEQYTDYYEGEKMHGEGKEMKKEVELAEKAPFNVDKFLGIKQIEGTAAKTEGKRKWGKVKKAFLGKRKEVDESLVRRLVVNGHFVESPEELFAKKEWRITGTGWKWAKNLDKNLAKSIDSKCAHYANNGKHRQKGHRKDATDAGAETGNLPNGGHRGRGEHALCILGHLFAFCLSIEKKVRQQFQMEIPEKLEWIRQAANAIFRHFIPPIKMPKRMIANVVKSYGKFVEIGLHPEGIKEEENGQKKTDEELPKEEEKEKSIVNHKEMEQDNGTEKPQELIGEEKKKPTDPLAPLRNPEESKIKKHLKWAGTGKHKFRITLGQRNRDKIIKLNEKETEPLPMPELKPEKKRISSYELEGDTEEFWKAVNKINSKREKKEMERTLKRRQYKAKKLIKGKVRKLRVGKKGGQGKWQQKLKNRKKHLKPSVSSSESSESSESSDSPTMIGEDVQEEEEENSNKLDAKGGGKPNDANGNEAEKKQKNKKFGMISQISPSHSRVITL